MIACNKRQDINQQEVISVYCNDKLSLRDCAKKFGCDRSVITRILKENRITIRDLKKILKV